MKRIKSGKYTLVLAIVMLLLCGCAKEAPAESAEPATQTAESVKEAKTIDEIYDEITASVELYSPFCWDDEFITNYYGIDITSLEEYVFSMSEEATSAETIIIMKAKDAATVSDLSDCLQMVVDEKKNEMENYLPEQFDIVAKSSVQTKDNYVWLVISENADAIITIIENSL